MINEKEIISHILDHHYLGNGLYGLIDNDKLIANFSNTRILDYFFNGLEKVIQIKSKDDFNGLLELFNIIPMDIKNFLLKYIFTLEYFHKQLNREDFKTLCEKIYDEYKKLSEKYNVYC